MRQVLFKVRGMLRILIAFSIMAAAQAVAAPEQPNVVLIMSDDLGYHDLGCYGHPQIRTPVLDQLARDGIRFTSFYAGATVCTPSRMALLTGAYPPRLGWTKGVVGHMMAKGEGMSPKVLTIAEIFKSQGYRTGLVGKWHLGDEAPFRPHRQGFDSAFYINKSNNQTDEIWENDEVKIKPFANDRLTEKFTREAISFIEEKAESPFLLYIPFSAPHFPVEAHPDWKGRSTFGVYGDVVEEMDHRIGEILASIKAAKIDKRTIVVFLSDNGPEPMTKESKATPYRGKKWSALEGGTRVPCIIRWPGVIPAGQVNDGLAAAIDLLPTLSRACNIDLSSIAKRQPVIDGLDLWRSLIDQHEATGRKELLYWHGSDGLQAIRVDNWKLFLDQRHAGLKGGGPALFNLAHDVGERINLSEQFPDRVRAMSAQAMERLAEIQKSVIPLGDELSDSK
jgi:arylsulfatase A